MLIEKLGLSLMGRNLSAQKTRMPFTDPHTTWDAFASGLFLGKENGCVVLRRRPLSLVPRTLLHKLQGETAFS